MLTLYMIVRIFRVPLVLLVTEDLLDQEEREVRMESPVVLVEKDLQDLM